MTQRQRQPRSRSTTRPRSPRTAAPTSIDVLANDSVRAGHRRDADGHRRDPGHERHGGDHRRRNGVSYTPNANFFGSDTLHLHDQRRQRRHGHGDGHRDRDQRQRQPGRGRRRGHGRRGQRRQRRSTCWPTTRIAPDAGETLTVTAVTQGGQRLGDVHRRRRRELHAERELLRHRHLHLHDQRRQRRHGHGDGHRDGDATSTTTPTRSTTRRRWPRTAAANAINVLANDTLRAGRGRDADGHGGDARRTTRCDHRRRQRA